MTFAASASTHLIKVKSGHSAKCLYFPLKWDVPLNTVAL